MKTIKTILVDDEPRGLSALQRLLEFNCPDIEIIGLCSSADEAKEKINALNPELVFLDIAMPEKNGFDLLNEIEPVRFEIIFVTAHDDFMLQAFRFSAVDYLLKPFSKDRFDKALQKLEQQQLKTNTEKTKEILEEVSKSPAQSNRVVLKDGGKIKIIPVTQIHYLEAADDYVKIHTAEGAFLKKKTMQFFEDSLATFHFVRVHRSYIINTQLITRIDVHEKDNHLVLLSSGVRVPVSKQGYARLKEVLGL